jgi:hypothetical protein
MTLAASPAESTTRFPLPAEAGSLPQGLPAPLAIPYLTGIMRGHLLTAMALAETNHHEAAVIHTSHPIDENFGLLAPLLPSNAANDLRIHLSKLNETMALKADSGELDAAYHAAVEQLQRIEQQASAPSGISDHQMLMLAVAWLVQGADEYEEAWSGLELRNVEEYQDGYGFYTHARTTLAPILPRLDAVDASAATEIGNAVERMALAWPEVIPPAKPGMATSTLRALIAVIEINSRRFGA